MKTETLVYLLEQDITLAKEGMKSKEGYPFICGWLEECVKHMDKVIKQFKEDNDE